MISSQVEMFIRSFGYKKRGGTNGGSLPRSIHNINERASELSIINYLTYISIRDLRSKRERPNLSTA